MRPGFGITKERSLNRAYGTIIGGWYHLQLFISSPTPSLYLYIAIICMPLLPSDSYRKIICMPLYSTYTLQLFLFLHHQSDIYTLIYDRLLDTVIGVVLSFSN